MAGKEPLPKPSIPGAAPSSRESPGTSYKSKASYIYQIQWQPYIKPLLFCVNESVLDFSRLRNLTLGSGILSAAEASVLNSKWD